MSGINNLNRKKLSIQIGVVSRGIKTSPKRREDKKPTSAWDKVDDGPEAFHSDFNEPRESSHE